MLTTYLYTYCEKDFVSVFLCVYLGIIRLFFMKNYICLVLFRFKGFGVLITHLIKISAISDDSTSNLSGKLAAYISQNL